MSEHRTTTLQSACGHPVTVTTASPVTPVTPVTVAPATTPATIASVAPSATPATTASAAPATTPATTASVATLGTTPDSDVAASTAVGERNVSRLGLFEGYGVELEYMIVDQDTLDVKPVADALMDDGSGQPVSDVTRGPITWSNELVRHVIELKVTDPVPSLTDLAQLFATNVRELNQRASRHAALLLPSGMHPWMDPRRETVLWPHEYHQVYEMYDALFDCRQHGFANLQAIHINLPFRDDAEFGRLHAAVRLVLPLLPALTASSPFREGNFAGCSDSRLLAYSTNSSRLPICIGEIIPEPIYTEDAYVAQILTPIYVALRELDPTETLIGEFANARGAIARFARGSLEIRLMDMQECPLMDIAVLEFVVRILRSLTAERWSSLDRQQRVAVAPLAVLLRRAMQRAEHTCISEPNEPDCGFCRLFGVSDEIAATPNFSLLDLLRYLFREVWPDPDDTPELRQAVVLILQQGTLATRMLRACQGNTERTAMAALYRALADCLQTNRPFTTPICATAGCGNG